MLSILSCSFISNGLRTVSSASRSQMNYKRVLSRPIRGSLGFPSSTTVRTYTMDLTGHWTPKINVPPINLVDINWFLLECRCPLQFSYAKPLLSLCIKGLTGKNNWREHLQSRRSQFMSTKSMKRMSMGGTFSLGVRCPVRSIVYIWSYCKKSQDLLWLAEKRTVIPKNIFIKKKYKKDEWK